jgi:hypothetical protein
MNKRIRNLFKLSGIPITLEIRNLVNQFGNLHISDNELLERICLLKNISYDSYEFAIMYPHLEKIFIRIWILIHSIEYTTDRDYTHIYSVSTKEFGYYIVIRIWSINDLSSRISIEIRDLDCTHCPGPSITYELE